MQDMLLWDPKKRPTASQCLKYPYFQVGQHIQRQRLSKRASNHGVDAKDSSSRFDFAVNETDSRKTYGLDKTGTQISLKDSGRFESIAGQPKAFGDDPSKRKQSIAKKLSTDLGEFDFDELEVSYSKARFPSLKKMVREF